MKKEVKHLDVQIGKDLHYQLRLAAAKADLSITKFVTKILEEKLKSKRN